MSLEEKNGETGGSVYRGNRIVGVCAKQSKGGLDRQGAYMYNNNKGNIMEYKT